jgi:hypothetical protein
MSKIEKSILSVAGEFAVAAELCRRNIYAQPTFGHQKRMDLLAFGPGRRMLSLEVKSKQGPDWPNCKGIADPDTFLVFVDFEGRHPEERPDFYVLSSSDWRATVEADRSRYTTKHPDRDPPILTDDNVLRLVNAQGRVYEGCGVRPEYIRDHKEKWQKIADALHARSQFMKAEGEHEAQLGNEDV